MPPVEGCCDERKDYLNFLGSAAHATHTSCIRPWGNANKDASRDSASNVVIRLKGELSATSGAIRLKGFER